MDSSYPIWCNDLMLSWIALSILMQWFHIRGFWVSLPEVNLCRNSFMRVAITNEMNELPTCIYCCAIRILPCGNEFRHKLTSGRETPNPRIVMDNSYPFWCNEFIPSWIVLIHFDAMISYCDQALSQVFHPKSTLMKWNCDPSHEFIASKWTTAIPYLSSSFIVMEYR